MSDDGVIGGLFGSMVGAQESEKSEVPPNPPPLPETPTSLELSVEPEEPKAPSAPAKPQFSLAAVEVARSLIDASQNWQKILDGQTSLEQTGTRSDR